jgi:hypothetical protein
MSPPPSTSAAWQLDVCWQQWQQQQEQQEQDYLTVAQLVLAVRRGEWRKRKGAGTGRNV